jgi:hypothetical protein
VALDTGEELLAAALGNDSALAATARAVEPFIVPYDQLARVDGWFIWLGHPPAPDGLSVLPVPGRLLWDEPITTLAVAAAVAADYAARRGARSAETMRAVLERESPVAIVVPDDVVLSLRQMLSQIADIGVPVVDRPAELATLASLAPFALRRDAHASPLLHRPHDPALSFQEFVVAERIGGDARSSYILHNAGERDHVAVIGEIGERVAIEIGVRGQDVTQQDIEILERQAAIIPSFLNGVTSRLSGSALEIGWRRDVTPDAKEIADVFAVWLKALYGVDLVDVRVAFAPASGRSALLAAMKARARAIRRDRHTALSTDRVVLPSSAANGLD